MRVLVSGFEPFGGLSTNPTMELIERAKGFKMDGMHIQTITLPVVYSECIPPLLKKIEEVNPDVIVCLGVAVGRASIDIERIGINIQDTVGEGKKGDNSGDRPVDRPIVSDGPDGLFSTLPIRNLVDNLKVAGIPATISNSAGTYICNTTLYSVLNEINNRRLNTKAGFIHVPATPDMVTTSPQLPSMSIETEEQALKIVLETLMTKEY